MIELDPNHKEQTLIAKKSAIGHDGLLVATKNCYYVEITED